jgi:hypothetical protein
MIRLPRRTTEPFSGSPRLTAARSRRATLSALRTLIPRHPETQDCDRVSAEFTRTVSSNGAPRDGEVLLICDETTEPLRRLQTTD